MSELASRSDRITLALTVTVYSFELTSTEAVFLNLKHLIYFLSHCQIMEQGEELLSDQEDDNVSEGGEDGSDESDDSGHIEDMALALEGERE